jgi:diaminohydroxyphosphoribosylaminopyrimidine deaminase/5-amino-6-(5-phosphoribosylamino)uracil reductase
LRCDAAWFIICPSRSKFHFINDKIILMWTAADHKYMREALRLAKSAEGRTSPDPLVGAVIVKGGRQIANGFHGEVATPHAEAWAISKAEEKSRGATLYVNLEPCNHYGNNPPCTDLIIASGLKRVVAAMKDPNRLVNGRGFAKLKKHGLKVEVGLMDEEAKRLNEVFIKYITTGRPFVVLKEAMTLDGKIAARTGRSRWVAGPESLRFAHQLRNTYDAILVGIGNVLIDNPQLNVRRVPRIKDPIRIVLDAYARTPLRAKVLRGSGGKTIIVVGPQAPAQKIVTLRKAGAEVLILPALQGKIKIKALIKELSQRKITSLLVEGGGEVAASFIDAGVIDKAHFIIAPKIFGGREAKTPVEGRGVAWPFQARWLKRAEYATLGSDFMISGYF